MDIDLVLDQKILSQVKGYCDLNKDEERCGIITDIKTGGRFIGVDNLAENKKLYFFIDPEIYIMYNIDIIVHSHCMGNAEPSLLDKKCSDDLDLPFLIYSSVYNNFCLYRNKRVINLKV